jgi:transposase-like protein
MHHTKESFIQLLKSLHDKTSCREFLEKHRWNGIPACPHCGRQSAHHYRLKVGGVFDGLYKCEACGKRFTVTIGTMFERSHVSLER